MRCEFISFVAGFAALTLTGCAAEAEPQKVPGYLQKDITDLSAMFAGRWDNDRHIFFAEDADMNAEGIAPRQHIIVERAGGADDPHTFTATRKLKDGPTIVLTHSFRADAESEHIVQTSTSAEGQSCEAIWQRSSNGFMGASSEGCHWMYARPDYDGPLEVSLFLSDPEFWVTINAGDRKTEARMRKARPFECWTAILRGEEHGTTGADSDDWFFQRGVMLHDQYGEAILETDETSPRKISLRLRNVDWPYGRNRPSLTMYVHEAGNDRAISYAWGEYNAKRIGINLRWLQASCTYAPEKVYGDF